MFYVWVIENGHPPLYNLKGNNFKLCLLITGIESLSCSSYNFTNWIDKIACSTVTLRLINKRNAFFISLLTIKKLHRMGLSFYISFVQWDTKER